MEKLQIERLGDDQRDPELLGELLLLLWIFGVAERRNQNRR